MPESVVDNFSVRYLSILDENGVLDAALLSPLSPDDIRTIYWFMNLSRTLNTKMLSLQKQGRLGTFASILGQEGGEVALAYALRDLQNIWLAPTFRETAVLIARGVPMENILQYWGGDERGSALSKEMRILPVSIPIGSQCIHAVGLAMAMQIKKEKGAAIAFFGDGATSEGETCEALNFAGVFSAPVVFFCQNNQYAISVPRDKQTAAKTLAQKAIAFGFSGIQVDGNDVFAVYKAVRDAVEKAMSGGGPTFIEAITYRLDNHTTADDWHVYRSEDEVKSWQKKDSLLRLRTYMTTKGMWNDEHEKGMLADAQKKVEEAVKIFEAAPRPLVSDIFDFLYAKVPEHLSDQKKQFADFWGGH